MSQSATRIAVLLSVSTKENTTWQEFQAGCCTPLSMAVTLTEKGGLKTDVLKLIFRNSLLLMITILLF